jgi:hypothetical protein
VRVCAALPCSLLVTDDEDVVQRSSTHTGRHQEISIAARPFHSTNHVSGSAFLLSVLKKNGQTCKIGTVNEKRK